MEKDTSHYLTEGTQILHRIRKITQMFESESLQTDLPNRFKFVTAIDTEATFKCSIRENDTAKEHLIVEAILYPLNDPEIAINLYSPKESVNVPVAGIFPFIHEEGFTKALETSLVEALCAFEE